MGAAAGGRPNAGIVDDEAHGHHAALSAASVQAVAHLRFRPGRYRGEYVRVVIQMPISWLPPK